MKIFELWLILIDWFTRQNPNNPEDPVPVFSRTRLSKPKSKYEVSSRENVLNHRSLIANDPFSRASIMTFAKTSCGSMNRQVESRASPFARTSLDGSFHCKSVSSLPSLDASSRSPSKRFHITSTAICRRVWRLLVMMNDFFLSAFLSPQLWSRTLWAEIWWCLTSFTLWWIFCLW